MTQPANTTIARPPSGSMMLFVRKSRLSKKVPLRNVNLADQGPKDMTVRKPSAQMIAPTTIAACTRWNSQVSISHATAGSIRLIADVQAANVSSRKKITAMTMPPGICPKASGSD